MECFWGQENFSYHRHSEISKKPIDRMTVESDFSDLCMGSNGLIYGFQWEHPYFSLWAMEEGSLDAIWQAPIKSEKRELFALGEQYLYLADGSDIICLDKKTGIQNGCFSLSNKGHVCWLGSDNAGFLYIVQEDNPSTYDDIITIVNSANGESSTFGHTISVRYKDYFIAGTTFGYYGPDQAIHLHSNAQAEKVITVCLDDEEEKMFFEPCITTKGSQVFFKKCLAKNSYQLTCFDTATNTEKWSFDLPGQIYNSPCISEDGNRVFMLYGDSHIIAFENKEGVMGLQWELVMPKEGGWDRPINELVVSADGKTLFGLQEDKGLLYTIDASNGSLLSSKECDHGRIHRFIGVTQGGLPCVQGIRF